MLSSLYAFLELKYVGPIVGVILVVGALFFIPEGAWENKKRKIGFAIFLLLGILVILRVGIFRGIKAGLDEGIYATARLFTPIVSSDKMKDEVLYHIWSNIPDKAISLVVGKDGSVMLVSGLRNIPENVEFLRRNGKIFLQEKEYTCEKVFSRQSNLR